MPPSVSPARHLAAREFLAARINYERYSTLPGLSAFKLDRMRELLRMLANPQDQLRIVHVAGTKGKGSTASMIAAVLSASGVRTALYTSPHLFQLEERFRVDGQCATAEELVELVEAVRPAVEALDGQSPSGGGPTWFETTTAMAFVHFVRCRATAAVLEVGLGGRLDSTNVCLPEVCAITSISFDHTRQLGETLAAIAAEKAGIIKPGVPVVSGVVEPEPLEVISEQAARSSAPLFQLGRDFHFEFASPPPLDAAAVTTDDDPSLIMGRDPIAGPPADARQRASGAKPEPPSLAGRLSYREQASGKTWRLDDVRLGLAGRHQAANAAVCLAAIRRLIERGWTISEEAIRAGLGAASLPARVQLVRRAPWVVVDTAHNGASVAALVETIASGFLHSPRILLLAASRDKDLSGMVRHLVPFFPRIIATQFHHNPRAVPAEELASALHTAAAERNPACRISEHRQPADAWRAAMSEASPQHLVCVTGSFFLVSELWSLIVPTPAAGHNA